MVMADPSLATHSPNDDLSRFDVNFQRFGALKQIHLPQMVIATLT